jgi:acetyl-CoA carboxylase biotin carboxylase subunit
VAQEDRSVFAKVLIAGRGESALRVLRACRELGVPTVAVHSRFDADARAVRLADESFYIGPAEPDERLQVCAPALMTAARLTGADAVHPGAGPLAEDPDFAEICADHRVALIGAGAGGLACAADRARAKGVMRAAGLPVVPGPAESARSARQADEMAQEMGYPVVLKPVRRLAAVAQVVVRRRDGLEAAYDAVRQAARRVTGAERVYVEKFLEGSRRVEVQVLCDDRRQGVHLGERHSPVRCHGRALVAEAPVPLLTPGQRERLGRLAVRGALAAGCRGGAAVAFLLDREGHCHYLEVRVRLPLAHLVTEMRSGIDVVQEQVRLAAGEPLRFTQDDVQLRGHAFACDVQARDPEKEFLRSEGPIQSLPAPGGPGTRVDTDVFPGWTLPPFYEPSLAKLAVWAEDRAGAVARMRRALRELAVEGLKTTAPFQEQVFSHPGFARGEYPGWD